MMSCVLRNSGLSSIKFLCATLSHMSITGRVVLPVTFQEVDAAPHAQAAAQGDHQSLQHVDSVSEKIHKSYFLSFCRIVIEGRLRSIRTSRKAHPALRWPVCVSCTVPYQRGTSCRRRQYICSRDVWSGRTCPKGTDARPAA